METIFDYITWRGDLTLAADPFNDVDNYIIAKLGTPDWTAIIPGTFDPIGLKEALRVYTELYGESGDRLGALTSGKILPVSRMLPDTKRFKELTVSGFRKTINEAKTEQFSALTVGLPDGRYYISFRGTDDTLLGWKENLMMSVEPVVAAQQAAADYLREAAETLPGRLLVGGHSKGGNLAVYAASQMLPEVRYRIDTVYSNDGPGFLPAFLETEGYQSIRPKVRLLIPEHSVVGTLLTQDADPVFVKSRRTGITSHDGFAWQVMGPGFVRADGLSESSRLFHRYINDMTRVMSVEERRTFIDDFFGLLTSTGAETITELTELRLRDALKLANSLRKSQETRRFLSTLLEVLWKD